jgi:hypothetical protein
MEALMIINSILVAMTLYFIKGAHADFKELVKKVDRLEGKVRTLCIRINRKTGNDSKN